MKKSLKNVLLGLVLALMFLPVPSSFAANVFPVDSAPYGRTYAEWMTAWQQWAISIPAAAHPLFFDNLSYPPAPPNIESTGQSGPVFFLGGKFCRIIDTTCGVNNVVRDITVPSGKALFFPIMDAEYSTVETGQGHANSPKAVKDINTLRQMSEQFIDTVTNVWLNVDGVKTPNYRVQSTAFGFYLPAGDIFTAIGEGCFSPGYYFPGIDDGYVVMLKPLSSGKHKIHFHGEAGSWVLDITYNVQVL